MNVPEPEPEPDLYVTPDDERPKYLTNQRQNIISYLIQEAGSEDLKFPLKIENILIAI